MREYEFNGIDVLSDMRQLHNKRPKSSITTESIEQDKEYVRSFEEAAGSYSVGETSLVPEEYYFPITTTVDIDDHSITLVIVTQQAKYIGVAGSRLEFRYDSINKPIYFPQDFYLSDSEYRFVFSTKEQLDQIVNLSILKFKNSGWFLQAVGYDSSGTLLRISNI